MSFRFLNFPVYKDIKKFVKNIYRVSSKFPKEEQFGITSQIRRAAISIALNLAEGSDRGSDREFRRFINIALGSLNETVAVLDIGHENDFINTKNYDIMLSQAESIAKQLSGLRKTLKK